METKEGQTWVSGYSPLCSGDRLATSFREGGRRAGNWCYQMGAKGKAVVWQTVLRGPVAPGNAGGGRLPPGEAGGAPRCMRARACLGHERGRASGHFCEPLSI